MEVFRVNVLYFDGLKKPNSFYKMAPFLVNNYLSKKLLSFLKVLKNIMMEQVENECTELRVRKLLILIVFYQIYLLSNICHVSGL